MILSLVQFTIWEKNHLADPADFKVKSGDLVVVATDYGEDVAQVIKLRDFSDDQWAKLQEIESINTIVRLVNSSDRKILDQQKEKCQSALSECQKIIKRCGVKMKLIDCNFSFDDKRISFAFTADGRIDFREAVKELNRHFQRNIRLHQLGVRDEAKMVGDVGGCGFNLCCRGPLKEFASVTADMADKQQIAHRGSDRLSGVCGRLKCCLAYEKSYYDELAKKLPPVGSSIKTDQGMGEVVGWHTLRSSVDVKVKSDGKNDKPIVIEVPIKV